MGTWGMLHTHVSTTYSVQIETLSITAEHELWTGSKENRGRMKKKEKGAH